MMNTSRRDFVIKTALAAAGITHGYMANAAIQKKFPAFNTHEYIGAAKICLFSKDLPKMGFDEMSALIAAAGFDGIDLTVRKDGHVLPENVTLDLPLAVEAAQRHGLKIYMITTDIINAGDKFTEIILKTAAGLGIGFYRMGPRFYDDKKSIPQNLIAIKIQYKELEKLNKKYKIRGECQNHSGERFGAAIWDQWEVLKDLNPRWIGVQYDLLHAILEGAYSWPIGFELVKPYIGTMDIKDFYWKKNDGKWDQELTPLGEGMVDFKRFIPLLKANNLRGPFSIHCEYLSDKDDRQVKAQKIKKDLTTLRVWLNEAGL